MKHRIFLLCIVAFVGLGALIYIGLRLKIIPEFHLPTPTITSSPSVTPKLISPTPEITNADEKWLAFHDDRYNITFNYPESWKKITQAENPNYIFELRHLNPIPEMISIYVITPLKDYLSTKELEETAVRYILTDKVFESNNTKIAGYPTYKIVYSGMDKVFDIKNTDFFVSTPKNIYVIGYRAESTEYNNYLYVVNKLIESFRLIK